MDWIMSLMQQAGLELGAVEGWGFDLPWHKILSAGAGTCVYCLGAFRSHACRIQRNSHSHSFKLIQIRSPTDKLYGSSRVSL